MKNKLTRFGILALLAAGIASAIVYREQFDVTALQAWLQELGPLAPIVFMLIYALATVLFLPGSVLTLAGGVLFGPMWGTFYNLTGATIGATLAFLIARYIASGWVEQKAGGKLKHLIEGVESEGWRFVAFVRLVPLFPFNLLNYALGLTRIKLSHYIVASYVCMLPGAVAYTYLGYAGREAVAGSETMIQKGLLALGLLALVVFIPRMVKRMRAPKFPYLDISDLRQRLDQNEELLLLDVRTHEEYNGEMGHIAHSQNISVENLHNQSEFLQSNRERPIAIICRTERRSLQAAEILAREGFTHVAIVRGGMVKWNHAGLPIVVT
jgi:uncharacterized membrane protein YdjX (TVP38/TMEM64 family)/rhodanese-related sulfurtransferase